MSGYAGLRNDLGDRLWVRLPDLLRRHSPTAGMAAADGGYVRAWPRMAIGAPVAAGSIGGLLAAALSLFSVGPLYTYSFTVVALLIVVAGLGAGIGGWAWAGFTAVNLGFADRSGLPGFSPFVSGPGHRLFYGWLPLALTQALLFGLLVLVPLLGRLFGESAGRALRRRVPELESATVTIVSLVALALLTYSWAQAVPFMIRPLWNFSGSTPEIAAVQPIQSHCGLLAAAAVLGGVIRLALMELARPRLVGLPMPAPLPPSQERSRSVPRLVWVPVQALVMTLLIGGLVTDRTGGAALWLAIVAIGYLRTLVVPRLAGYTAVVRRVPAVVRVLGCAAVSYLLTHVVVQPAVDRGESSFISLATVILASLLVAAFLLPGRPPEGRTVESRAGSAGGEA